MDVVGAMAIVPSVQAGAGSIITSAAMNLMMLMSFGMFAWLTWFNSEEEEEEDVEVDTHGRPYPRPRFLSDCCYISSINIACIGLSRCGKSSLVNALLRLRPADTLAAKPGRATLEPAPHVFIYADGAAQQLAGADAAPEASGEVSGADAGATGPPAAVRIWDMPAAEAQGALSKSSCCRDLGLAHFDAVCIVYAGRLSEAELNLARVLDMTYNVPCFLVRSQIDVDLENELVDHGLAEEEILPSLRQEAVGRGAGPVFLVSAREPERHDMQSLRASIGTLARARGRAKQQTECPICFGDFQGDGLDRCSCHWCGNVVCGRCARKLDGGLGEVQCPFCRRWTSTGKASDAACCKVGSCRTGG